MGPLEAEQIKIVSMIQDFWDEVTMGPIKYPNEDVAQTMGDIRSTAEISHPAEGRKKESIGKTPLIHSLGFLTFVCHLPLGNGKLRAVRIADAAAITFDNAHAYTSIGDLIVFRELTMNELGEKEGTYRVAIVIPFRRQQIG